MDWETIKAFMQIILSVPMALFVLFVLYRLPIMMREDVEYHKEQDALKEKSIDERKVAYPPSQN